jgi:hypothetical protein
MLSNVSLTPQRPPPIPSIEQPTTNLESCKWRDGREGCVGPLWFELQSIHDPLFLLRAGKLLDDMGERATFIQRPSTTALSMIPSPGPLP